MRKIRSACSGSAPPVPRKWSRNIAGSTCRMASCAGAKSRPDVALANGEPVGRFQLRGKAMKRITTFGLALGFSSALTGTASAQVKLAVGGPITGPSAATGVQMKNGVDQAAADINAAGGIDVGRGPVSYTH